MDKTIKIKGEDYKIIKDYSDTTHIPIWFIVKKMAKRYFGNSAWDKLPLKTQTKLKERAKSLRR